MLFEGMIRVSDFINIFLGDIVNCLCRNIKNDWVRLVIKSEPNSMRHDNPNWNSLYDPNAKNIVIISKAFYRKEILMAADSECVKNDVTYCFNQLRGDAHLLYVAIEWQQYEEQEDGELKYKPFEEVLYDFRKERY